MSCILHSHKDLTNAFKHGVIAMQKRKREMGRTKLGNRTVFTKDEFCIQSTRMELFGLAGWIEDGLDGMTSFFPEFDNFSATLYQTWKKDDTSKETFIAMEDAAFDALKTDMKRMYAILRPLVHEAIDTIKTTLFSEQQAALGKRKSPEDQTITAFPTKLESLTPNIEITRSVCGDAQAFFQMIINDSE